MATEKQRTRERALEDLFVDAVRRSGWMVRRHPHAGQPSAHPIIRRDGRSYLVELKRAPDGRRDRLLPIFAQAVLQAQAAARRSQEPAAPLAIVGTQRVSKAIVGALERFVQECVPDVAVGLIDLEGFRWFRGPGLESMNRTREPGGMPALERSAADPIPHMFSDLNQWMLKALVAPAISPDLLNAPRGELQNASQLAAAANVSVMSAFRFVRQLRIEGFLDESSSTLRLVQLEELLKRWQSESRRPFREIGMQWVLRGDPARQLHEALHALRDEHSRPLSPSGARGHRGRSRMCIGAFAAADALGLGLVHGVAAHVYLEKLEPELLRTLGLSMEVPAPYPEVYIRVPTARESTFRGAVVRDGVPVSDVIQVWLDCSANASRGPEQADLIYRRVLKPLIDRRLR